jgi:hypothetical protein
MLTFIDVIPSRNSIAPGDSLNILGGAANHDEAAETDITVWGNTGNGWKALLTEHFHIEKGEHKHLYFTLTPEMMYSKLWEGEPDEFDLIIRDTRPADDENGVMIFLHGE